MNTLVLDISFRMFLEIETMEQDNNCFVPINEAHAMADQLSSDTLHVKSQLLSVQWIQILLHALYFQPVLMNWNIFSILRF